MLQTSALYKELAPLDSSIWETKVIINGVEYTEGIQSCERTRALFTSETLSFGGCYSSNLELTITGVDPDTVPKNAEIQVKARVSSFDFLRQSEWIPQGTYFISKRKHAAGTTAFSCYDALMKTNVVYIPEVGDIGYWPRKMSDVVKEIFAARGITMDDRTVLNDTYMMEFPNDYTEREILGYVAAAHCGNWIMTLEGKALLVTIDMLPSGTSLLIDNFGSRLVFGEGGIIV